MRNTNSDPMLKSKLRLTNCACLCFGVLATLGIGFGVSTCISALSPGPALAAGSTQQVDLSDPNIRVTYATDGTMYVDVYVHNDNTSKVYVNTGDQDNKPLDEGGNFEGITEEDQKPDENQNPDGDQQQPGTTEEVTENSDNTDTEDNDKPADDPGTTDPDVDEKPDAGDGTTVDDGTASVTPSGDDVVYDIVWGDTLTKLSQMTGYSVDFLAEYNHIADPNLIYAGSTLRYPRN